MALECTLIHHIYNRVEFPILLVIHDVEYHQLDSYICTWGHVWFVLLSFLVPYPCPSLYSPLPNLKELYSSLALPHCELASAYQRKHSAFVFWGLAYFRKLGMEPPFDPAIPLLGLYPKDLKSAYCGDTATSVFIAAQFTIAKLWNQPRCPSTGKYIKKMWYVYTM